MERGVFCSTPSIAETVVTGYRNPKVPKQNSLPPIPGALYSGVLCAVAPACLCLAPHPARLLMIQVFTVIKTDYNKNNFIDKKWVKVINERLVYKSMCDLERGGQCGLN